MISPSGRRHIVYAKSGQHALQNVKHHYLTKGIGCLTRISHRGTLKILKTGRNLPSTYEKTRHVHFAHHHIIPLKEDKIIGQTTQRISQFISFLHFVLFHFRSVSHTR